MIKESALFTVLTVSFLSFAACNSELTIDANLSEQYFFNRHFHRAIPSEAFGRRSIS
jgi:hypothetical protein